MNRSLDQALGKLFGTPIADVAHWDEVYGKKRAGLKQNKSIDEEEVDDGNDQEEKPQAKFQPRAQSKPQEPVTKIQSKNKNSARTNPILSILKPKQLLVFAGSSEQGKTHLIKSIIIDMCLRGDFNFGIVFCPTKFNKSYDFIKNQNLVIGNYNENILKQYLKKVRDNGNPPNFIIFDDCAGEMNLVDGFGKQFISTFRHYNCSVFISTQYIYSVAAPVVREQTNRAFIWKQNTKRAYDALYESYGLAFEDFKDFKKTLDTITAEQYRCMVYLKEETEIKKKYLSYKASEKIPDVQLKF